MGINNQDIFLQINEKQINDNTMYYNSLTLEKIINKINQNKNVIIDSTYLQNIEHSYASFTLKNLYLILEYYGLKKNQMKKNQIIHLLAMYEADSNNQHDVEERLRLWKNINELKQHIFFNKFISFD